MARGAFDCPLRTFRRWRRPSDGRRIAARIPSLDILVHCAGIMKPDYVAGMNLSDLPRVQNQCALALRPEPARPAGLEVGRGQVFREPVSSRREHCGRGITR